MNIEIIKWMVEYADGFEWEDPDRLDMPHGSWTVNNSCKNNPSWNNLIYPLLLQRAIERINISTKYTIEIMIVDDDGGSIGVGIMINSQWIEGIYLDHDQAKEAALEYIYEQEKNNGNTR